MERLHRQVVAAHLVEDHHVERRRRGALFVVAANVESTGVRPAVDDLVERPRVAVEGEDDVGLVGEQLGEGLRTHAVRMERRRKQRHAGRRR